MLHEKAEHTVVNNIGTITITPAATTKIYPHQALFLVATVQMAGANTIPSGATIDFSGSINGASLHFKSLDGKSDYWKNVEIVTTDNKTGTATLCIRHDFTDTTNTIVVNAKVGSRGWAGNPTPGDASTVSYTVLTHEPTIVCTGPSNTWLDIPGSDQLTPSATASTTAFTCQVTDGSTPVPGYVVEWHEASDASHGLFSRLVNAYASESATYADKLPSKDGLFVFDDNQQGYFVRMATGADGKASLYLVAKQSVGAVAQGIEALYDFQTTYEYARPFVISDPKSVARSLKDLLPTVVDQMGETVDFDHLQDPPYVTVTIPYYSEAGAQDNVYLIVNGAIAGGPFHFDTDNQSSLSCQFLASLAYSETMGGTQKNTVRYVIGVDGSGQAINSPLRAFTGTGDNIQLQGGDLDAPVLSPAAGYIDYSTIATGTVAITVALDQDSWTAQPGDTLTAIAVLTGYKVDSSVLRTPVTVHSNPLPPLTADDIDAGSVTVSFPVDPFANWDRKKYDGQEIGNCCIVYTVNASTANAQRSQVRKVSLDTADQSYKAR